MRFLSFVYEKSTAWPAKYSAFSDIRDPAKYPASKTQYSAKYRVYKRPFMYA